jgi:TolB protein
MRVRTLAVAGLLATTAACTAHPAPRSASPALSVPAAPGTDAPVAAGSPSASPTAKPAGIGPLFYIGPAATDATIRRWVPGAAPTALPGVFTGTYLNTNVSPDGHWASWVDDTTGTLRIVDLGNGKAAITRKNVDAQCAEPVWAPDSRHLLLRDIAGGTRTLGVLDVTTGTVARLPYQLDGCHLTWSADGTAIGYVDGAGKLFVARADGSRPRRVPGLGDGGRPATFDLESVSAKGDLVAFWVNNGSAPAGDVARGLDSNAIVDTRTGNLVALPADGLLQAVFHADGTMLARVKGPTHNQILLVSPAGSVLARVDEPAGLKDQLLLTT